jgi:hypothetical protein
MCVNSKIASVLYPSTKNTNKKKTSFFRTCSCKFREATTHADLKKGTNRPTKQTAQNKQNKTKQQKGFVIMFEKNNIKMWGIAGGE